ncbi:hypothetical protein VCHC52A1_2573, partial [Vibrio cholerae HC-52A1]
MYLEIIQSEHIGHGVETGGLLREPNGG